MIVIKLLAGKRATYWLAVYVSLSLYFGLGKVPSLAQTMDITYGVNGGLTYSLVNAVFTVDGIEVGPSDQAGSGLLGYSAGVFGNMPISNRLSFDVEAGYDVARFRSFQSIYDVVSIRHVRLGISGRWVFLNRLGLVGGIELISRSHEVTGGAGRLSGADATGLYWQGVLGLSMSLGNRIRIDARTSIPKLKSVTGVYDGPVTQNRFLIEQLRIFKLVASYTLSP